MKGSEIAKAISESIPPKAGLVGRITSPHNLISQIHKRYYIVIGRNRQDFSKTREVSFREMSGHVLVLKKCPFCPVFLGTKSCNSCNDK